MNGIVAFQMLGTMSILGDDSQEKAEKGHREGAACDHILAAVRRQNVAQYLMMKIMRYFQVVKTKGMTGTGQRVWSRGHEDYGIQGIVLCQRREDRDKLGRVLC